MFSFPAESVLDNPAPPTPTWMDAVKRFFENPVVASLASLRLTIPLLVIFAVAIAKATFIESDFGAEGARGLVYNALWFEVLLSLFCVNLLLRLFKDMPYKPRQAGVVIVHVSMIVILASAGITRWFGYEGIMQIREGESTNFIWSRSPHIQMTVGDNFDSYAVRLFATGQSLSKKMKLGGDSYRVAVDEYWPAFEMSYQTASDGPAALEMAVTGHNGLEEIFLVTGQPEELAGVKYRLVQGALPGEGSSAQWGEIKMRIDGQTTNLAVTNELPVSTVVNGWSFEISEFQASFRVGGDMNFDAPMDNPMVRVGITSPDGTTGEKVLFAYHPDFAMGHSGAGEEAFENLDIIYAFEQGVVMAIGDDGNIMVRTAADLNQIDMDSGQPLTSYPGGAPFALAMSALYRSDDGQISFVVREAHEHVQLQPGVSYDPKAPAAARISVTAPDGSTATDIVFKEAGRGVTFDVGGTTAIVKFGSIRIPLPYRVHLDDFMLINYPGSRNPASYESHVRLYDESMGIDGKAVRIYMNHPLTHRNFKHFQSSYDTDEKGTVLSVNYDPGKWPTYIGYILISLGFALIFARDLIWPRKNNTGERSRHAA